ncbi:ATP-dependent helicase HrpB [Glaciecola sp. XM2]|uniref:ATP-dependent helicase HrpB n=1 Tax=Glaciecola sp. XM2 TaxID=1914931 RepID=UPI001BDEABE7|nr:ATP-dependent helicase HrpB [Glaciecola sp. XM2]
MLPVETIFQPLAQQMLVGDAIVIAPPGAGKSTCLPLYLLSLPMFSDCKIIMLQPRRIAARSIAAYLAQQLSEQVGETVGYRIRGENKTSPSTRLEIVTEGVLTRMLQSSGELPSVGLIIFDEFHERNLHADFSLALSLEVQQALREDLRILVMSATLDVESLARFMPNTPVLQSDGRQFDVDIHYATGESKLPVAERVSRLVIDKFGEHQRDWLVFLPGALEIKKTAALLNASSSITAKVMPLYADLNKKEQQRALEASEPGEQKIVLATNIAETSLTIDGIEVVVDSGLEKRATFDLRRGVMQLAMHKISQASATQRAGRAGRLMPGTCYRMWPKEQHHRLAKQSVPEILQSDISSLLLEATVWGTQIADLALIDPPSNAQQAQASDKLKHLGILDSADKLTPLGKKVHALGTDVNLAVMLIRSESLSEAHQSMACAIAAVLESKDPMFGHGSAELALRLQFLQTQKTHSIWQLIRQWHKKISVPIHPWPLEDTGLLLAFGFVDWVAKPASKGRFTLANGSGATLADEDEMLARIQNTQASASPDWLAIGLMQITDKQSDNARIRYAQTVPVTSLRKHFESLFTESEQVVWEHEKQKISASKHSMFGKIIINKTPLAKPSEVVVADMWRKLIEQNSIQWLPLGGRAQALITRAHIANAHEVGICESLSIEALQRDIDEWLLPYLIDKTTLQALSRLDFYQLISQRLSYPELKSLNELLPEALSIPTGRKVNIEYSAEGTATVSVRMQEVYGLNVHPRLLKGRIPITFELLSPAQRPLQTTQDIVGFWAGSYKEIQKEMKGRYPRHFWPDEPANSPATTTTKKRMT